MVDSIRRRLLKTGAAAVAMAATPPVLAPWKDTPEKIPLAVRHVRSFLLSHRSA